MENFPLGMPVGAWRRAGANNQDLLLTADSGHMETSLRVQGGQSEACPPSEARRRGGARRAKSAPLPTLQATAMDVLKCVDDPRRIQGFPLATGCDHDRARDLPYISGSSPELQIGR